MHCKCSVNSCKCYVNSCWRTANSSFAFQNFLEIFSSKCFWSIVSWICRCGTRGSRGPTLHVSLFTCVKMLAKYISRSEISVSRVWLFCILIDTVNLLSWMFIPIYITTCTAWQFLFPHILANTGDHKSFGIIATIFDKWKIVSLCSNLLKVDHLLFILVICCCFCFPVNWLFISFAIFVVSFHLYLWIFQSFVVY